VDHYPEAGVGRGAVSACSSNFASHISQIVRAAISDSMIHSQAIPYVHMAPNYHQRIEVPPMPWRDSCVTP